jgi:hypothetical protein
MKGKEVKIDGHGYMVLEGDPTVGYCVADEGKSGKVALRSSVGIVFPMWRCIVRHLERPAFKGNDVMSIWKFYSCRS